MALTTVSAAATTAPSAVRAQDFQRTIELINKYTLSTLQFMNRFSAVCEDKLLNVNRQLQRLEAQVELLEYKLDSIDNEGIPTSSKKDKEEGRGGGGAGSGGPPGASAPAGLAGAPPPMQLTAPPPLPGQAVQPPMMPGFGQTAGGPPPPPGTKMPPLPPGVVVNPAAGSAGGAPMMPPPPMMGAPPPGFVPPPPPPIQGGLAMRQHPKLQGYFKMAEAGVPVAAIKAKMTTDGYNPDWFDTPMAPAPSSLPTSSNKNTMYDSD